MSPGRISIRSADLKLNGHTPHPHQHPHSSFGNVRVHSGLMADVSDVSDVNDNVDGSVSNGGAMAASKNGLCHTSPGGAVNGGKQDRTHPLFNFGICRWPGRDSSSPPRVAAFCSVWMNTTAGLTRSTRSA